MKRNLENARKIAAIHLTFYESGDKSVFDILHDIDFLRIVESCTREDYLRVLKMEPRLAALWYQETEDRRSFGNLFYIVEVKKGEYRVVFDPSSEHGDKYYLTFSDKLEACAFYIELEVQHLFEQYHRYLDSKNSPDQRRREKLQEFHPFGKCSS